ncbi:hypothetical protein [Pseudalkalibacillus caeni]|uniref:Uncharacterized protein n=1 Tax=Exobacillus caeni TaxID=2574798 RepID=A0A5R9EWI7_9BACL|nr:hypothetical protein [Pseudalkalibacillus caeni]TLS35191.1 hypothetical protein FCL54_21570 [Pseudalkalibacillus caeni]
MIEILRDDINKDFFHEQDFLRFSFEFNRTDCVFYAGFTGGPVYQGKLLGTLLNDRYAAFRYRYIDHQNKLRCGNCTFQFDILQIEKNDPGKEVSQHMDEAEIKETLINSLRKYLLEK